MKEELYYFDDAGNSTTKELASRVIARRVDEKGELVEETFGYINDNDSDDQRIAISQEQYDYFIKKGLNPDMEKFKIKK